MASENERLKRRNLKNREKEETLTEELEETKHELCKNPVTRNILCCQLLGLSIFVLIVARKESINRKLKETNVSLEQEVDALTHKIERMNTMQRQVRSNV